MVIEIDKREWDRVEELIRQQTERIEQLEEEVQRHEEEVQRLKKLLEGKADAKTKVHGEL